MEFEYTTLLQKLDAIQNQIYALRVGMGVLRRELLEGQAPMTPNAWVDTVLTESTCASKHCTCR